MLNCIESFQPSWEVSTLRIFDDDDDDDDEHHR